MNVQESLGKYWKDRAEWGLALPEIKTHYKACISKQWGTGKWKDRSME